MLNPKSVATVLLQGLPHGNPGYMGRGSLAQELSAVSIDCVVMRKQIFTASGGLDKEFGLSQVGAVAFCLRLRENQLRVIWCPEALWTVTAGSPTLHETHQQQTFLTRFGQKYALWLACDPAYHPLLDAERADFSLQVLS